MRFLSIGECMAELAPLEKSGEFKIGFAGDTFNTAWYMAQIAPDVKVEYLTAVGDDKISHDLRAFIRSSDVCDVHVSEIAGATVGLYLIHLANGERSFSYWRGQSAARQLAVNPDDLDKAMEHADLIYYSGITLAILDTHSCDNLLGALERAGRAGKTVAFDTDLRPRLWESAAEMKSVIMRAAAQSDVVLPSYDDEAEWFGDESALATLDRYAQIGVKQIIVKNSSHPVSYQDSARRGEVDVTPAANVVDTTAAGDSFNAGALVGLLRNSDMRVAITEGCCLARHVVQQKGALVPIEIAL